MARRYGGGGKRKRARKYKAQLMRTIHQEILNQYPPKEFSRTLYYGISNGKGATKTTATFGRDITWGRWMWRNQDDMADIFTNHYIGGSSFEPLTESLGMFVDKYVEKHTIQNACLFPVVVSCYEWYFPADMPAINSTFIAKADPGQAAGAAATEIGYYNVGGNIAPDGNAFTDTGATVTTQFMAPIALLYMWNLKCGVKMSTATIPADTDTSWFDSTTFSGGQAVAAMSRPVGTTRFKFGASGKRNGMQVANGLSDMIVYKKKGVVTLNPGQQKSWKYVKTGKLLSYRDANNAAASALNKGGGGLIFHAVGLMVHDATTTGATLQSIARSSIVLNIQMDQYMQYKTLPSYSQVTGESATGVSLSGVGTLTNERRAGLAVTEYASG